MNLIKYNRHWENGFKYPFPNARTIFSKLVDKIPQKQIVEIAGLRRTGKTTLLFQLINHCINSGQNQYALWYFAFDEEQPHLDNLLSAFSSQTQIDFKTEYVIVFLDEIQKLQNFQNQIKVLLTGQFIECIQMENYQTKKEYLIGILKKIIFEDIPSVFPILPSCAH